MNRPGNTPIAQVMVTVRGRRRPVHLKLEGANPCGSLKDRTAASLIDDLEQRGALAADSTLIESTSGNLGVALASIARRRGYAFTAIVDPKYSNPANPRAHERGTAPAAPSPL